MLKILIAEDDFTSRKYLYQLLSKYGECDVVVDGLETIDAYMIALNEKKPYDLICLDIMMPKVDGVKALKMIRELEGQNQVPEEERVKIIMTTALGELDVVQTALEYGCNAYAAKPINVDKLMEVIDKLDLLKND